MQIQTFKNPKVSVLIPTYNQEKYIQDCINSVLNQTFQDFEIIINDDFSSDDTLLKIKEIKDDRIKILQSKYNQGINAALDNLIKNAQGEFVVFHDGDDMLKKQHLEKVVNCFNSYPEINTVYCNIIPIDEKNNIRKDLGNDYIKITNSSTPKQLHQAFMYGNFAISPGMTMRKSSIERILPLPYSIINNQDFKVHIDLLLSGSDNYIIDEKLVLYRQPFNKTNVSAKGFNTELRESLEFEKVMESFLNITDIELLKEIFKKEIQETGLVPYSDTIPYFLGRMAILAKKDAKKAWGYHKIVDFLATEENFNLIKERYNLEFKDFLGLVKTFKNTTFHRCFKYKKLFNAFLVAFIISTLGLILSLASIFLFLK